MVYLINNRAAENKMVLNVGNFPCFKWIEKPVEEFFTGTVLVISNDPPFKKMIGMPNLKRYPRNLKWSLM